MSLPWPRGPLLLLWLAGVCCGIQVFVRDEKRYTVLFQAVVLPCHYTSISTQTPVVQWVYKSYCRDRTRDTFGFSDSRPGAGGATTAVDYLDCADSSRTVRTVASIAGSSVTLSEYYKNRDISISNKADLRIGEVQWGDSGVYTCKVVISDDLEGQSEGNVELLVLDLLPGVDIKLIPEWVFVGAVALGGVLVLLLLGVCWCQCCPHSCCCYVRCSCCPETCCCPRHLYEAGKGIKVATPTPQVVSYPPYFVSGMPTMVPIAPPSLVDHASPAPPSDSSLLASGHLPYRIPSIHPSSTLPSTQDQTSLRVLQYVEKQLAQFSPTRSRGPQCKRNPSSLSELSSLHEGEAGFRQTYRDIQKNALPAIPDRDPSALHRQRSRDDNRSPEPRRWNPRSEVLQRKAFRPSGPTGSLDQLELDSRRPRGEGRGPGDGRRGDQDKEEGRPSSSSRRDGNRDDRQEEEEERSRRERKRTDGRISPLASPPRRRGGSWDPPPPPHSSRGGDNYDGTFLSSLLERKARLRGAGLAGRGDQASDPPSKGSGESGRYRSRSPNSSQASKSSAPSNRREEPRDRPRKTNTLLSRVASVEVTVSQTDRSTMLFASVTLRCDYSTSANLQDVLVTWTFKSFCKDPVLEFYSTAYQSALSLNQDPSNDCPDRQRTVRIVVQKKASSVAILGPEYQGRRISVENSVLLIILFGVCCCQCCPQKCCCYIRCPCCPEQCCCPEKAVMQHRMIKDAQKAMAPWMGGQPLYAPMSQNSQMNPLLYSGSASGKSIPMQSMPLPHPMAYGMPPPPSIYGMPPPPSIYGNHTPAGNSQMLDQLENQMRGMDMTSPLLQPMVPPHHPQMMGPPLSVPFSPGPPSMLSALNDDGPNERRVITLPPIREQPGARGPPRARGPPPAPKTRPPSSSESSRSGYAYRRDDRGAAGGGGRGRRPSPTRSRAMSRSYSQDSLDGGSRRGPSRDLGQQRSRSRDDIHSRGNYSPPASHRSRQDSWSSDDEASSRRGGGRGGGGGGRGRGGGKGRGWVDNPPSYTEYEPGSKPGTRRNYSVRQSLL
ncbi:hypothetical protein NHX12_005289 [Muraenolepis orangiensis]|uniref:Ig-like domain-containing protein n=1 Tax=Muraenolepis orangiensis TaxID=630683 RepID=A0A9Q0DSN1_9TELE|nr:hypothetical protein NHX12_005289 [Muraenolepis orangiensis]